MHGQHVYHSSCCTGTEVGATDCQPLVRVGRFVPNKLTQLAQLLCPHCHPLALLHCAQASEQPLGSLCLTELGRSGDILRSNLLHYMCKHSKRHPNPHSTFLLDGYVTCHFLKLDSRPDMLYHQPWPELVGGLLNLGRACSFCMTKPVPCFLHVPSPTSCNSGHVLQQEGGPNARLGGWQACHTHVAMHTELPGLL